MKTLDPRVVQILDSLPPLVGYVDLDLRIVCEQAHRDVVSAPIR